MKLNSKVRYGVTGLTAIAAVPVAANWQAISDRMGWSTAIADVVVPEAGPSPVAELVSSPSFLITFLVLAGIAIGVWLDTAVRALDRRRSQKLWWSGLRSFTIKSFSCIVAGVHESEFENSLRAKAVATEIRGYVNSGHMPLMLEMRRNPGAFEAVPSAPYAAKDVSVDAVVLKSDLEGLARARDWELPWPIPPKRTTPEPLANAPVLAALVEAGRSAQDGKYE